MKKLLLAVLLVLSPAAMAASMVAQFGPNLEVRIYSDRPCKLPTVDTTAHPDAREAEVIYNGKHLKACWKPSYTGEVAVIDEEGDSGILPLAAFKPDKEV